MFIVALFTTVKGGKQSRMNGLRSCAHKRNGISLSQKKGKPAFCDNMDEP